jgi:hypothetical protein
VLAERGAMYCTKCGSGWPDSAEFCGACGTRLPGGSTGQAPARQPQSAAAVPTSAPVEWGPGEYPPDPAPAYPQPPVANAAPSVPAVPARRWRPLRRERVITVAVGLVVGALVVTGWRVHWPSALFGSGSPPALTWTAAQAPLPADATRTARQDAALNDVACPAAGSCVAVGIYDTGSDADTSRGLIETLSGGTWTPAAAPFNVPGAGAAPFVDLDGIACPSMATCVAVGSYDDSKGNSEPLTETREGGTWVSARAPLPGDAAPGKSSFLSEVACPAPGTCVATGWYTDQNGNADAVIDTLSGRTWTTQRAPLPDDAKLRPTNNTALATDLVAVRCGGVGDCVATGDYFDVEGHMEVLIDTLSGGTWTADRIALPADAAVDPAAYLWALACQGPGSCLAAGHYNDRRGQSRDFVATLSGGTWTPAATPLPGSAAASQQWTLSQLTGLTALACRNAVTCAAGGSYFARNGALDGEIASQSGGTWTAARAPLPAGAAIAKQFAFFDSGACPAAGTCYVVGGYKAGNGATVGMIETGSPAHG